MLLRAGQSPLEPRLVTVLDGPQTEREPHPTISGQPDEELPADHLRIDLAPGHYTFELSAYRVSGEVELLLHRLRPVHG